MSKRKINSGDIIDLCDTQFVVLDNDYKGNGDLFILTLETVGTSKFGETNNYATSDLCGAIRDWVSQFIDCIASAYGDPNLRRLPELIKPREISLATADGHGRYGWMNANALPLTHEEAREYAEVIPRCVNAWWLATGWGGSGYAGAECVLRMESSGSLDDGHCKNSYGIRPALVIDPALLELEPKPSASTPDLSAYTTDELWAEISRRVHEKE